MRQGGKIWRMVKDGCGKGLGTGLGEGDGVARLKTKEKDVWWLRQGCGEVWTNFWN